MSLDLQVLQVSDLEEILDFENTKLAKEIPDETERRFHGWQARWRRESLEHYLRLGWSFAIREEGELLGYFLAQPLLFLDGQTQSLWVEHLQYLNLQARDTLCDLAVRTSREKHLQRVYFPTVHNLAPAVAPFRPENWQPQTSVVKTTK